VAGLQILGAVIGDGFAAVLAAAKEGSETAFSRLWRDGNPALLRYLRVIAPDAAEDIAADTWLQVVRGLAGMAPARYQPRQQPAPRPGSAGVPGTRPQYRHLQWLHQA
jgi:hypothetical protein